MQNTLSRALRTRVGVVEVVTTEGADGWTTELVGGPLDGEEYRAADAAVARETHRAAVLLVLSAR